MRRAAPDLHTAKGTSAADVPLTAPIGPTEVAPARGIGSPCAHAGCGHRQEDAGRGENGGQDAGRQVAGCAVCSLLAHRRQHSAGAAFVIPTQCVTPVTARARSLACSSTGQRTTPRGENISSSVVTPPNSTHASHHPSPSPGLESQDASRFRVAAATTRLPCSSVGTAGRDLARPTKEPRNIEWGWRRG